ncbi:MULTISPECIES: acyl-CoA dehydrogenase family protein [Nocardia]|uniref:acyl-CoA dehydrogenase family protein n=1 Tax=Nocardia TaxID=1817 RepID=UPI000BF12D87|nr:MULTISPECIES: acyl-CoA dehydrogenase family protein [Nocardia]MBF6184806.1 acyl-CoA/acyl-ACP dehydrogenase [Nocardia farcinica]MBF6247045.1 acyl-CoA/acyl-ACP dehydrogenase [Nocardia elegans]MBF6310650.1 acyl-CoA/acyl-ACP dehydrogenase [Nocardia farcinica]MBF6405530.1 acyl-CoA/acyl-ACP dehydrogenase [Nocardia farcinica]PEH75206.1 acyl-CoA dehydrogenase [Nocardia sp. FDAARGOS_372]
MTAVLTARTEAAAFVRDRAAALDRGETDVRTDLAALGDLGLLGIGLGERGIGEIVAVIEDVAAESLTVAFSLWAQRMTIEYVARAPEPVRTAHLGGLVSGRTVGVTAMAAALKHLAGLGELPLAGVRDGDRYRVTGPIAWASNVFPDALIVFPFRDEQGCGRVACTRADAAGVEVRPCPELLALGATASTSLRFTDVTVPAAQCLTADLPAFGAAIRPTFLLLQSAFCTGIARTALAESAGLLDGIGAQFRTDHDALATRHADVRARLHDYAADPAAPDGAALLTVRLDAARLAVDATRLEFALRGGAGYATAGATNRRFREAAFLPIQSPSEGQLRWELSRYR